MSEPSLERIADMVEYWACRYDALQTAAIEVIERTEFDVTPGLAYSSDEALKTLRRVLGLGPRDCADKEEQES